MIWEFESEVVEGQLSFRLLQPLDPVWHHVSEHLSERVARLPFAWALISFFFLLYPLAIWLPSLTSMLLFLLVTAVAFALRFLMQYTFALLAFWRERAHALEQFSLLCYLFLSGLIAPLEVFPPLVREIAQWTPFPYMVHFPVELFIDLPTNPVRGGLVMLGWGIVCFVINRWLWRRGLRQYSGMGA